MGNSLEKLIRIAGRQLADMQIASIFKVPEDMSQTPCDFFGYTSSGRAILIEAKKVRATSLKIGGKPGLAPHQWAELDDANRANAIALIAWQNGAEVAVISMDQAIVWSADRKSIPWRRITEDYVQPVPHEDDAHLLLQHWLDR